VSLATAEARALFATQRVVRLATKRLDGQPHLVVICFAQSGDTVYTAVDQKPKRTRELARLRHIAADPRVALLADHYEDDWTRLWWVRADGRARIVDDPAERARALELLSGRYPQYRERPPHGPVLAVDAERWSGWKAVPGGRS
jgi:PPOX class probable F420-dependent enzyme